MIDPLQTMRDAQIANNANGGGGNNGGHTNGGCNRNAIRYNRKIPDNASFQRLVTDKYCWTHGACNHTSGLCNKKAPEYKDAAIKANKMDGSNTF